MYNQSNLKDHNIPTEYKNACLKIVSKNLISLPEYAKTIWKTNVIDVFQCYLIGTNNQARRHNSSHLALILLAEPCNSHTACAPCGSN